MRAFVSAETLLVIGFAITVFGSAWIMLQDCSDPNDVTTFGGGVDSDWTKAGNWDRGVPSSTKCAVIPKQFEVVIPANTTNAACKTLMIEVDEEETGTLKVNQGAVLTLGDGSARTSTVDGKLIVGEDDAPATLKIHGEHTIQGEGGRIQLKKGSLVDDNGNPSTDKVILKSSQSTCESRSCSVKLHGSGTVEVALDNRAFVVGDALLNLKQTTKTGTSAGHWMAESGGEIKVFCQVSGAAAWEILDIDANVGGKFSIMDEASGGPGCVNATGPATLWAGTLTCQA